VPKITAERAIWWIHDSEFGTEMTTTHKLDEVATPEMTAKAWDDYLHRFGSGAYISARYGSSVRDMTLSPYADRLDRAAADRTRPVRAGLAQAA